MTVRITNRIAEIEEFYKNGFANLALPIFAFSSPILAHKQKYYETDWTLWDRFELDAMVPGEDREMTLQEFMDHFLKKEKRTFPSASFSARTHSSII